MTRMAWIRVHSMVSISAIRDIRGFCVRNFAQAARKWNICITDIKAEKLAEKTSFCRCVLRMGQTSTHAEARGPRREQNTKGTKDTKGTTRTQGRDDTTKNTNDMKRGEGKPRRSVEAIKRMRMQSCQGRGQGYP
jgi:hypothetical protein